MRAADLKIGKTYRLKSSPNYGFIKVIEVLDRGSEPHRLQYIVAKVKHTVGRHDVTGFIRYFRPRDIIKDPKDET